MRRSSADVVVSERFLLPPVVAHSALQQYSLMYTHRLSSMRQVLLGMAQQKWPGARAVARIIDCEFRDEEGGAVEPTTCIIIGTVYKEMRLRQSVLDEFRENVQGLSGGIQPLDHFASEVLSPRAFIVTH